MVKHETQHHPPPGGGLVLAFLGCCSAVSLSASELPSQPDLPWQEDAQLAGSQQQSMWSFGQAVDLDEDVAVVGAPTATIGGEQFQGAVFVYRRIGDKWEEEAYLTASNGSEDDFLGWSVAVEDDRLLVGAPGSGEGPLFGRGSVYQFEYDGLGWNEVQEFTGSDSGRNDLFGFSMSLEGPRLVVGAEGAGPGTDGIGAAYYFELGESLWSEVQKLNDPSLGTGNNFGFSVDLDGDTLAIGNNSHDTKTAGNAGSVYVYTFDGSSWTEQQMLVASDAGNHTFLGSDVALDGDTLLAGAEQHDVGANIRQGAAYVFTRSGSTWTEQQQLLASDGQEDSSFGTAVALAGPLALVGAELDLDDQNMQGVVYEYRLQGGIWTEQGWFKAPIGQGLDTFGEDIEIDGRRVIVGNSNNGAVNPPGAAWIFLPPVFFGDGFESGDTSAWSITVP